MSVEKRQETCEADITIGLAVGRMAALGRRYIAQKNWAREHLNSTGCKLTNDEAAAFKEMCDRMGVTRYATIRALIKAWLLSCEMRGY